MSEIAWKWGLSLPQVLPIFWITKWTYLSRSVSHCGTLTGKFCIKIFFMAQWIYFLYSIDRMQHFLWMWLSRVLLQFSICFSTFCPLILSNSERVLIALNVEHLFMFLIVFLGFSSANCLFMSFDHLYSIFYFLLICVNYLQLQTLIFWYIFFQSVAFKCYVCWYCYTDF